MLAQAAQEARAGRHEGALALLDRLGQAGELPGSAALDLRARICAQLGFALEAERLWSLAAQADPANPLYPLALVRLRQVHRPVPRVGQVVAVLGTGAVLLWLVGQELETTSALNGVRTQVAATAASDQGGLGVLGQGLEDLGGDTRHALAELNTAVAALAGRLDAAPTQPGAEAPAGPPGPAGASDPDSRAPEPARLLDPAGRQWRCEWQLSPAPGRARP